MGTKAVVCASRGSCLSIKVDSTSSVLWASSKIAYSELDLAFSSSSAGCGVCRGDIIGFFLLEPHGGDSLVGITFFPFSSLATFLFRENLPMVLLLYSSSLLLVETSNSESLDSK